MTARDRDESFKTALQVAAILCAAVMVSVIFHKAYMDLDRLAQKYSGVEFWVELAKQVLRNLAAGGG
jgi:hypothetical protein